MSKYGQLPPTALPMVFPPALSNAIIPTTSGVLSGPAKSDAPVTRMPNTAPLQHSMITMTTMNKLLVYINGQRAAMRVDSSAKQQYS